MNPYEEPGSNIECLTTNQSHLCWQGLIQATLVSSALFITQTLFEFGFDGLSRPFQVILNVGILIFPCFIGALILALRIGKKWLVNIVIYSLAIASVMLFTDSVYFSNNSIRIIAGNAIGLSILTTVTTIVTVTLTRVSLRIFS